MLSLYFVVTVLCFIFCGASQKDGVGCGFTSSWLESVVLSVKLTKQGFHSPPEPLQAAVPVHGRYHKASSSGGWERVIIEPPRLLLRSEHCDTVDPGLPHRVVDAPCTSQNQSLCSWLEIHGLQVPNMSLELPVGDSSLIIPVCAVTSLVSLLCSAFLFRAVWKHGIF
ncbi:hypothetical protein PGIGA_G00026230 [Pangasianodon gigas]|uniref:Uncharacterized protein n=1 Tax=Pangasianodon gigas TaxID=30993 RepID=A0ACC5WYQ7_PANGG|nr:hypothetical protein [Pangasianodon gigas]